MFFLTLGTSTMTTLAHGRMARVKCNHFLNCLLNPVPLKKGKHVTKYMEHKIPILAISKHTIQWFLLYLQDCAAITIT